MTYVLVITYSNLLCFIILRAELNFGPGKPTWAILRNLACNQRDERLPELFAAEPQHPSPPVPAIGPHSASALRPPVCTSETLPAAPPAGQI